MARLVLLVVCILVAIGVVLGAPIINLSPENQTPLDKNKVNVVEYTFTLEEWVVDFMRPTKNLSGAAARVSPYHIPNEQRKNSYLVNGQYPGPEIVCYEGDIIQVTLVNNLLSESISIHWHGIHMTDAPYMDGARGITQNPVGPTSNFTYRFNAHPAGSHYWHAHMDAVQSAKGVKGPIVVQKRDDPFEGTYDEEIVMSISDEWQYPEICLKLEGAMPGNDVCADVEYAGFNGQYGNGSAAYPYPVIKVEQGKCYRLRMIMMGSNAENFVVSLAGHDMTLLATDGYDVNPIEVKSVNVHLGERYDVRFCADQEIGAYLINMTYDYACSLQPGNFIPPGFSPVPTCQFFGYLLYDGAEIPTNLNGTGGGKSPKETTGTDFDLTHYDSFWKTSPLEANPRPSEPDVRYVVNMGLKGPTYSGPETPPMSEGRWYMDLENHTRPWVMPVWPLYETQGKCGHEDIPILNIPEDAREIEIVINNLSPTAHIIHMHGLPFSVINFADYPWCDLSHTSCFTLTYLKNPCPKKDTHVGDPEHPGLVNGMYWGCAYDEETDLPTQNLTSPLLKDTFQVWQRSWAVIRFTADNPGYWMFHCHMEQHIPLGMQMVLNVLPSKQPEAPSNVPGAMYNCLSEMPDDWKIKQEMEKLRLENQVLHAELKMMKEKQN